MKTNSKHSPLPFSVDSLFIRAANGDCIAKMLPPVEHSTMGARNGDAQLIVTAVNSHTALVGALEGLVAEVMCDDITRYPHFLSLQKALEAARAALVLALGEGGVK